MRSITTILFTCCLLIFNHENLLAQRVGIGTTQPIARLSIDSGINIDQSNLNNGSLEVALTFGNNKKVGIGSQRNPGLNRSGLDLFTNNLRRISIDSMGRVGVGTSSPTHTLHVNGQIYSTSDIIASGSILAGVVNGTPSYYLQAPNAYITSNMAIGTLPSSYALDVDGGSVRFREDFRVDGIMNANKALTIGSNTTIDGNATVVGTLVVKNNKGIVRTNSSAQYKILRYNLQLSTVNLPAGSYTDSGDFSFETFSTAPAVLMGNIISYSGDWQRLVFMPFAVDTNSCRFRVFNHGSSAATATVNYTIIVLGQE